MYMDLCIGFYSVRGVIEQHSSLLYGVVPIQTESDNSCVLYTCSVPHFGTAAFEMLTLEQQGTGV
jgi:hypothetical protein